MRSCASLKRLPQNTRLLPFQMGGLNNLKWIAPGIPRPLAREYNAVNGRSVVRGEFT